MDLTRKFTRPHRPARPNRPHQPARPATPAPVRLFPQTPYPQLGVFSSAVIEEQDTLIIPVRRDFPEILLPDNATGAQMNAGSNDVLPGAWTQICSAAQFGASPLILAGASVSYAAGLQTSIGGLSFVPRQGRLQIATGAAASETLAHALRYGGQAATLLQNPGPSTVAAGVAVPATLHRLAPVAYPGSTRLSARAAVRDNTGSQLGTSVYGVAYDASAWHLQELAIDYEQLLRGQLAVASHHTDYTVATSGAASYANGPYATCNASGGATADADYLVTGVSLHVDPASGFAGGGTMVDLAIGAAGSEVIQSRAVIAGALVWQGMVHFEFPLGPFYWAQGERLAARVRDNTGAQSCIVSCNLWRLP